MSLRRSAAVVLVRHAHAEWPDYSGRDFDRPLTERGRNDATTTAAQIAALLEGAPLLLASPALRTRQTAEILVKGLELPADRVRFVDDLYNASSTVLEKTLRSAATETDTPAGTLILVAHNPGVSDLARRLSGDAKVALAPAQWREVALKLKPVHQG